MIKVVNKGYTLTVVSWENDADNYNTKSVTYDTKEEALLIAKMCKELFVSRNSNKGGIGNTHEGSEEIAKQKILEYVEDNSEINKEFLTQDDDIVDYIMEINYDLLGSSEWYYSRVFESATLTYSPEHIFVEQIEI